MSDRDDLAALTLVVLAKHPSPGRSKTRLCPPCRLDQAATVAHAALLDTLAACRGVPAGRHVLALDGPPETWVGRGFEVLPQRGDDLGERIDAALHDSGCPALLVGMDTPQIRSSEIAAAARRLLRPGVDAVLGPCLDGGYWCVGLRAAASGVFDGVRMSALDTFDRQWERMRGLGLRVERLSLQRDVDEWPDALEVAALAPRTAFARRVRAVVGELSDGGLTAS